MLFYNNNYNTNNNNNNNNNNNKLKYAITFAISFVLLMHFSGFPLSQQVMSQENVSSTGDQASIMSASTSGSTDSSENNNQPNINAESIFNTKTMTLGSNVENLVILIPNEGHHDEGEDNEARFIDQHFVPENAIINSGTTIAWFNGDVGHERTVEVKDTEGSSIVFTTGPITDMELSPTLTLNNTGVYNYEAEGDEGVVMEGKITVVDNISTPLTSTNADNTASSDMNTVGVLMVPTQDIDTYIQDIQGSGLTIESMHDFNDLRGGQEGTGDVQTLIIWSAGGDRDLDAIISPISDLSSELPYS